MKRDKIDLSKPNGDIMLLSPKELLARVIDPSIDIRPIFTQYYSQFEHLYDPELTQEKKVRCPLLRQIIP